MIRYDVRTGVRKIKTKTALVISALGLTGAGVFGSILIFGSAHAATTVLYNSIPSPSAGNYPSQAFEAQSASEFGGQVMLTGPATNPTVTVQMSSWGCENGNWFSNNCTTTAGSTFSEPITLKVYTVGSGNSVGSLVTSVTQTFQIPYRPSASPICGDGRWSSDGTLANCFNGYATPIVFNVTGTIPQNAIISVAYNTSDYGTVPYGHSTACSSTSAGCGYDSLNVALTGAVTVGSQPDPNDAYLNSTIKDPSAGYCSEGPLNEFRLDTGCWTGFQPNIRIEVSGPAGDACKNGGWQSMTDSNGKSFKNQGDCVSFFATGGKNLASAKH